MPLIMSDKAFENFALEPESLVDAWILQAENFWAFEKLRELIVANDYVALSVIFDIAAKAKSDEVLGRLAVGPLEDMLHAHGDSYLDRIKEYAAKNPKFARCLLMGIRITGPNSEKTQKFIEKLAKKAVQNGTHPAL